MASSRAIARRVSEDGSSAARSCRATVLISVTVASCRRWRRVGGALMAATLRTLREQRGPARTVFLTLVLLERTLFSHTTAVLAKGGPPMGDRLTHLTTRRAWPVLVVSLLVVVLAALVGSGVVGKLKGGGFDDPASESSRAAVELTLTL